MLFHYASFLRRTYLTSLFYHRPTALLHMTFTKLVYTLRISWTFTFLALSLLGFYYQMGGRTAFWIQSGFLIMNRETVHFLLLSISNNILYAWEESIRIPSKNTPYYGPKSLRPEHCSHFSALFT